MLCDIQLDPPDFIVCYRLDRISRSVSDFSTFIEKLNRLGISFLCIKEEFDTSRPMGKAMMYIASVFSQLERETIAERVRDNMLLLARSGRWLGGTPPTRLHLQKNLRCPAGRQGKNRLHLAGNSGGTGCHTFHLSALSPEPIKRRKSHPGCKIAVSSHAPVKSFPLHPFVRSSKIRCTVSPTLMYSLILQNETQTFVSRLIRAPARDFSPTTNGTTAKRRTAPNRKALDHRRRKASRDHLRTRLGNDTESAFKLPPCSRKSRCSQRAPLQYTLLPSLRQPLWSQNDVPKIPISPLTTISAAKSCATAPLFAAVRISTHHRQTKTFCRLFAALCKSF